MNSRYMSLVFLVNALFALIFSFGQLALVSSYPFFITFLRMLVGGAVILAYQYWRYPESFVWHKKLLWTLLLLGLFNIYLTNGPELWGLQYVSAAKAAFIYNLAPFVSAFFAYLHFDEKMTAKKWIGLIIAFFGFVPVILLPAPAEINLPHLWLLSFAEVALIIATASSVYGWIIMQKVIKKYHYDITIANGFSMLIGAVFSLGHSLYTEPWHPIPLKADANLISLVLLIAAMVLFSNIIAYGIYAFLLKRYSSTFLSFTSFSCYLFAAFYDWVFTKTLVPWQTWIASAVFFVGLYIFYKEELSQGYINKI